MNVDWVQDYINSTGQKAAKNDDADIPTFLWNGQFLYNRPVGKDGKRVFENEWDEDININHREIMEGALSVIRHKFAFTIYLRRLYLRYKDYMKSKHGTKWYDFSYMTSKLHQKQQRRINKTLRNYMNNYREGKDSLMRAAYSTWWEWNEGSTLFFWPDPIGLCFFLLGGLN